MDMQRPSAAAAAAGARERIARLRQAYLAQLPERVAQARALCDSLAGAQAGSEAAAHLHRLLHNLKGTGRSFGLTELGACAERGEDLLLPLVDVAPDGTPGAALQALPADWRAQLAQCLDELAVLAAGLGTAAQAAAVGELPSFALAPVDRNAPATPGRLVYVCDDEALMLEQLAAQLACFGYEAVCFTDPDALHDAVLARRPDAVVMDIHFPRGHSAGIDVLLALREETGEPVSAVFVSARNDFNARLGAVRAGGQAYFVKPVRANALVAALDGLTHQQEYEPYRVLIVDDEPDMAHYHAILLQQAGLITCEVHDPTRILEALHQFRPDIVLMDMYMPECSGREAAAIIRQVPDHVGLPIVYLTSETDRRKLFSAMRIGAEGFLTKPVVPDELVAAVMIRAERMRTLRGLMARDSLTGLFNHTMTTQLLENALSLARRDSGVLSLVMIDIDGFKAVNDTWGHPAGDQVLMALSRVLQQRLRVSDIIGRYGGEEFAVILQNADPQQAARLIDALREDFARVDFYSGEHGFHCTFSAGVAAYPMYQRYELLREAADKALYRAKRGGRNRVVVAE